MTAILFDQIFKDNVQKKNIALQKNCKKSYLFNFVHKNIFFSECFAEEQNSWAAVTRSLECWSSRADDDHVAGILQEEKNCWDGQITAVQLDSAAKKPDNGTRVIVTSFKFMYLHPCFKEPILQQGAQLGIHY